MTRKVFGRGTFMVAAIALATMAPSASASAADLQIWSGDQITVTFRLPSSTNLLWTPNLGNSGAVVSEIANVGGGYQNGLATIRSVDLIQASTNTFVATFTVPAPEFGILWTNVYFTLSLPIDNQVTSGYASGGTSTTTYTYVTPPPLGQMPEVPYAAALPLVGLLSYGFVRWRKRGFLPSNKDSGSKEMPLIS